MTGDAAICGGERTEGGASGTSEDTLMSLASHCFTVMVVLVYAAGKGETDRCVHPAHGR